MQDVDILSVTTSTGMDFVLLYTISEISLLARYPHSTPSTIAMVSAASVLLGTLLSRFDCHSTGALS